MTNKNLAAIIGAVAAFILALVVIFGLAVGFFFLTNRTAPEIANASATPAAQTNAQPTPTPASGDIPFFSQALETGDAASNIASHTPILEIILRLFLALILSAILAFRPRRNIPLFRRNLYVAQTQILLAVVAAALMMIVGDNAARAFAIFAAVSFVRFRTNIRDPKEITVLLIALALGLAAGVGRWDLGLVLCVFAVILLWILEYKEPEQVFRSMELTVKTRDLKQTQEMLKGVFAAYKLEGEIRQIEPHEKKESFFTIMYYLNLPLNLSTDVLSEQINAADSGNIEGIIWKNQKNSTYVYQ
jgi:uncharacterized membrane protein YhiD involved in acid resistance